MWDNHGAPRAWTATALRETGTAFQSSRVLLTAIELRLFSIIGDGTLTAADIGRQAGTDPHATDRLLNALCSMHLLEKRQGAFRNTPEGLRLLVDSSPDYVAGLAHSAGMWKAWDGLTARVRSGQPAERSSVNDRDAGWLESFIAAMHYRARAQADLLAALLPLTDTTRVLDVGGGSGAFAMAMVRRTHGARAVVFDMPNVVPITRRYIDEAGLSDRVTISAGDYLIDPLPTGFDLVFLSAVVHSNSAAENAGLVARCADALNPGGAVVIADWVMNDDRVSPPAGAMFAINMLVGTDRGDTFTDAEMRGWLTAAGLARVERRATPFGTELLLGRR